ncbi:hypothetical protein MIMGU_mgv11b024308mg [Erythranthe guttata]|uniref:Uncharacterized protein n=1 Tax=Erythranthe guttata TaxID=4155 RepID=A0A022RPZ0_ERYGU|nr:hypothetical protein MIMGU_mgv11b024308mg [Erythranthe guttata]
MDEETLVRLSPLRPGGGSGGGGGGGGLKSSSSGKLSPRGSPSSRRLNSGQTPRREARSGVFSSHCLRSNRIVLWFGLTPDSISSRNGHTVTTRKISSAVAIAANRALSKSIVDVVLAKNTTLDKNKPSMRSRRSLRRKRPVSSKPKTMIADEVESEVDLQTEEIIPKKNTTYVFLVGPFGSVEDSILEWSVGEISVICARECNHLMELDTSIMGVQQERRKIKFPFPQFWGWHGCMLNWPRQECIIGAAKRTSGGF